MQFIIVAASLLASAGVAVATPPACLVSAIGVQGSDATDMDTLCDAKQELVLGNLTTSCADDMVEPAYEAYSSTCLAEAAVTVAALSAQSTGNASSTASADASDVTGSSNSSFSGSSSSGNSTTGSSGSGSSGNGTSSGSGDDETLDDASAASATALPGMVALMGAIAGAVALL